MFISSPRNINSFDQELWIESTFYKNDLLVYVENSFVFSSQSVTNIVSGAKGALKTVFFDVLKAILYLVLFPIRVALITLSVISYLILAPCFWLHFQSELKKVKALRLQIKEDLAAKKYTKKEVKSNHRRTKELLDNLTPRVKKLEGEYIMKPTLDNMLNEIKEIELMARLAAYPERNEIVLSYDELTELKDLVEMHS